MVNINALPKNEDGLPEYASVLITLDGRIPKRGKHLITKFVASTQSAEETLDNLFSYYREEHIRHMDTTLEAIGRGYNSLSAYVYVTAQGIVQIVVSSPTFAWLVQSEEFGNGSTLLAVDSITKLVAGVLDDSERRQGEIAPLHCLTWQYKQEVPQEELDAGEASLDEEDPTVKASTAAEYEAAANFLNSLEPEQLIEIAQLANKMQGAAKAEASRVAE